MTDCFKVEFHGGATLIVYEQGTAMDGRFAVIQPFNPVTGNPWQDEEEALSWWDTVKHQYLPPEPVEIEEVSQEEDNG